MKSVTARAPATIANLGSAFDCAGLAVNGPHDEVTARRISGSKIIIESISGYSVPLDPDRNTASVAVRSLLKMAGRRGGLALSIKKGIMPGSGLGSSAASAAAAVFAADRLLDLGFSREELVIPAMEGERVSAGEPHTDNVAPALLGNIIIGSSNFRKFDTIISPLELFCVIALPEISLDTKKSRRVLPKTVPLRVAAKQWSRVAFLVEGLLSGDEEAIALGLGDEIIESARKRLIPNFGLIKKISLESGAIGATISSSGPAMFALVSGKNKARKIAEALSRGLGQKSPGYRIFNASIDRKGTRIT